MSVDPRSNDGLARRVKAARALADLTVEELAAKLARPGLGCGPIKAVEQCRRGLSTDETRAIAVACRVPIGFFDEGYFSGVADDPVMRRIEAKCDALLRHLGLDPEVIA